MKSGRHLAFLVVLLLLMAGCSSLDGTGDKGYISGDGQITQYDPADRAEPINLTGTGLKDEAIDVSAWRGKVVLINVWWSACPPCRTETPMLVEVAAEKAATAAFLGIDIRDANKEPAIAFEEKFGVTYPSIFDPNGKALLAFSGAVSPRTIPSTVLLDKEGRVAALFRGEIRSKVTLSELIDEIASE